MMTTVTTTIMTAGAPATTCIKGIDFWATIGFLLGTLVTTPRAAVALPVAVLAAAGTPFGVRTGAGVFTVLGKVDCCGNSKTPAGMGLGASSSSGRFS